MDVNCVILFDGNWKDFVDLLEFVKEGFEVYFVFYYNDIYCIVFDLWYWFGGCFSKEEEVFLI